MESTGQINLRQRRALTKPEGRRVLDDAVDRRAAVELSVGWGGATGRMLKSRFLEQQSEGILLAEPVGRRVPLPLSEGIPCVVYFRGDNQRYGFQSHVRMRIRDQVNTAALVVDAPVELFVHQRRRYYRVRLIGAETIAVDCRWISADGQMSYLSATMIDLAEGGIAIAAGEHESVPPDNADLSVHFKIPGKIHFLELPSRRIHIGSMVERRKRRIGLSFGESPSTKQRRMLEWINRFTTDVQRKHLVRRRA